MCLAIPAQITQKNEGNMATVDIMGVTRKVSLDLLPQAEVGDYVLVHAGFGIEVISKEDAQQTLDLINQMDDAAQAQMSQVQ